MPELERWGGERTAELAVCRVSSCHPRLTTQCRSGTPHRQEHPVWNRQHFRSPVDM